MNAKIKTLVIAISATTMGLPAISQATNGMLLEGYGPISTGMGGTGMAFDNGTAAVMNNPTTLGLMDDGAGRFDVALGILAPDVESKIGGMTAASDGDSYKMPAIGWTKRSGQITYGAGVFAQGGMGTEYDDATWMGAGTGQNARSEVGVGRLIFPVAYNATNKLIVGGSVDYVWGGIDLKMPMPVGDATCAAGAQPGGFADFICPNSQVLGEATLTSGFQTQFGNLVAAGYDTVAINFSNNSSFTQQADGDGYAAKLGFVYKVNPDVTVGGAYHLETSMDDWTGSATMVAYDTDGPNPDQPIPGTITVKDFQFPAVIGAGVAYTPNNQWLLAGDIKLVQWSDVMKEFNMVFEPDGGSESADFTIYQEWDDQTVINLGAAYMPNTQTTIRFGANLASNPIPDDYVHPLFPAIVENHFTAGVGYAFTPASAVNFSLAYAPEVTQTNSNTNVKISHSQTNWQVMYSYMF